MTNAEWIRSLTDEQLAVFMNFVECNSYMGDSMISYTIKNYMEVLERDEVLRVNRSFLEWLQSEVQT